MVFEGFKLRAVLDMQASHPSRCPTGKVATGHRHAHCVAAVQQLPVPTY